MSLDLEVTTRFVAKWEEYRSKVYRDVGGVESIAYGETDQAFINRYRKTGISQPEAWAQLQRRILEFNRLMRSQLGDMSLTANQEGALTSLVYNIGPGGPDEKLAGWHDSPVLAALRAGDIELAAARFTHHNKAKGKVVRGLTNRRLEEAAWFRSGTPSVAPGKPGVPSFDEVRAAFEKWRGFIEGPRSNECPFNDWYYGRKVSGSAYPWCAAYVSYVLYHVGMPIPATTTKGFVYTPSGAAWFQKRSRWTRKPTVGALSFYDWGTRIAHVGWVVKVDPDGSFWAWEGNTDVRGGRTGGRVLLQHRSAASIGKRGGFGLLEYGASRGRHNKEDDVIRIIQTREHDLQDPSWPEPKTLPGIYVELNFMFVKWVPNNLIWDKIEEYADEGTRKQGGAVLVRRDEFDTLQKVGNAPPEAWPPVWTPPNRWGAK